MSSIAVRRANKRACPLQPNGILSRGTHVYPGANALLQAQPQGAFTIGLTVGHDAAHPVESEGHTCLNRSGGLGAVTGMAVAPAHAQWEALMAHAETQEHLRAILMPIFAGPIGRPRRDRPWDWAGLLFLDVHFINPAPVHFSADHV